MQPSVCCSKLSAPSLTVGDVIVNRSQKITYLPSVYVFFKFIPFCCIPVSYSFNESGATFIKLSGEKDISEAAAR